MSYGDDQPDKRFVCSVSVKATQFEVQISWIEDHFGEYGKNWIYYRTKFWFTSEEDATLFRLKWA